MSWTSSGWKKSSDMNFLKKSDKLMLLLKKNSKLLDKAIVESSESKINSALKISELRLKKKVNG